MLGKCVVMEEKEDGGLGEENADISCSQTNQLERPANQMTLMAPMPLRTTDGQLCVSISRRTQQI